MSGDYVKIYEEQVWIVNDEWEAADRGLFFNREDAEVFRDLIVRSREV